MSAKSVSLSRAPRPEDSGREGVGEPQGNSVEDVLPATAHPDPVAGNHQEPGARQSFGLLTGGRVVHDPAVVEPQTEHQPFLFVACRADSLVALNGKEPGGDRGGVRADAPA